ncbi:hypothetical protein [Falsibacillus albus]|uniref:hypothetical protein n=1 Tax=Falsibacillus albus TaxID=2478915 RepID=UPI001314FAE9|nr:hypothetical protein [Falsibacillus albus]
MKKLIYLLFSSFVLFSFTLNAPGQHLSKLISALELPNHHPFLAMDEDYPPRHNIL